MTPEDTDNEPHDPRGPLPPERRFELLERDVRSQARSLTAFVQSAKTFSPEQMEQLRSIFREELADAGLRIDGPEHVDDAREDFRFLRRLRLNWDGAAKKVGGAVLIAVVGVALTILSAGFWAWISSRGHP